MNNEINIHYEFQNISFKQQDGIGLAFTSGELDVNGNRFLFGISLAPTRQGEWTVKEIRTNPDMPLILDKIVLQSIINRAAVLLKTINVWPKSSSSSQDGATLMINEILAPSDAQGRVIISFRPNMLSLPTNGWEHIWEMIEGRILADEFFSVCGFNQNEVVDAVSELKKIFDSQWIRAKYRSASGIKNPSFGIDLEPEIDGWFPACHLARTALGAICIDPGWNYLIELGLAIKTLKEYSGLENLKRQLVRSSGTQHHICLAAELHDRGYLVALETPIGAGNKTNDLHVKIGQDEYDIEVKEFSSNNPKNRLIAELREKNNSLPNDTNHPVIFHAVLVGKGQINIQKELAFFDEISEMQNSIPNKISAIVAGRRFIDAKGGKVKRDTKVIILNPAARLQCQRLVLEELFMKNYEQISYPLFGIGDFFHFETGSSDE